MQTTFCPYCLRMVQTDICPYCGNDVNYPGNPMQLPVGYTLNGRHPYILGAAIGQGGFGITYIALDGVTGNRVAIKEYFPTHCSGRNNATTVQSYLGQEEIFHKGREQFLLEAQTLQSLSDLKGIVDVLDYFEANNTAYLVMEFLEGCSLKDYVEQHGKLPAQQFLVQLQPLMEDMEAMHQRGVIHRDIAPDNIMLLPDGRMKLIDFGAARSYLGDKSMTVVVKKGFAPVEQYMRKGSGTCTDVYALAATIYYCVTGVVPPDSAERQYGDEELQSPGVYGAGLLPEQELALAQAMEIQPKARTQKISQLLSGLRMEGSTGGGGSGGKGSEVIFLAEPNTIQENCPIVVSSVKLVRDHEKQAVIASGLFCSLSDRPIRSILIAIQCENTQGWVKGNALQYEVFCEKSGRKAVFGGQSQFVLPDRDIAKISVFIQKVFFADGSVQECGMDQEPIPAPEPLGAKFGNSSELLQEYRYQSTEKAVCVPVSGRNFWSCCCGNINLPTETSCSSCKTEREKQFQMLDADFLMKIAQRRKEREDRNLQRQAAVEKIKRFLGKQADNGRLLWEKTKKNLHRKVAELPFLKEKIRKFAGRQADKLHVLWGKSKVFLGDLGKKLHLLGKGTQNFLGAQAEKLRLHGKKAKEYLRKQGEALYARRETIKKYLRRGAVAVAGVLVAVIAVFGIRYGISSQKYTDAETLLAEKNYLEAYDGFTALGDFKDSQAQANAAMHAQAKAYATAGQYQEAAEAFEMLGSYLGSDKEAAYYRKMVDYTSAQALFDAAKYPEAAAAFDKLESFSDSKARANESRYRYAGILLEEKKYEHALEIYTLLAKYKNSPDLVTSTNYLYAGVLAEKKQYHEAYLRYSDILDYKDSEKLANEAEYAYGCICMENQNYEDAAGAFRRIKKYQDSATKYNEARYQTGLQLMDTSKWVEAGQVFYDLENYRDSAAQYKLSRYEYGCDLMEDQAYETAVKVLENLGNFKDCPAKVKEAKYQYALSHQSKTDKTTFEYLSELKKSKYEDSVSLYSKLFSWKVELIAVNTDSDDDTTKSYSVSRYTPYLHFLFKLSGGGPGEEVKLQARTRYPDGSVYRANWYWEDESAGSYLGIMWDEGIYTRPQNGATGTFTVMVYIAGTNECIGEGSIQITSS